MARSEELLSPRGECYACRSRATERVFAEGGRWIGDYCAAHALWWLRAESEQETEQQARRLAEEGR